MTIPKVEKTALERKLAAYEAEIERLSQQQTVESRVDSEVPMPVKVALTFVGRFQELNGPRVHMPSPGSWGSPSDQEPVVTEREPTVDELMILGAAQELIVDYFDRNNTKRLRALRKK